MGQNISSVVIKSPSVWPGWNHCVLIGESHNNVSHLKVYSHGSTINGIYFWENCTLQGCIIDTIHSSVVGGDNLIVNNSVIYSLFGPCITARETFEIFGCNLYPRVYDANFETPSGISAYGSGIIDDISVTASGSGSSTQTGYSLLGIQLLLSTGEEVTITNVDIDLQLTSMYKSDQRSPLHVSGIYTGNEWGNWSGPGSFLGQVIVRDCNVILTGIEGTTDPNGDGAGIKVDGICNRAGGTITVLGNSTVKTSRTKASHAADGYEYLLNNESGTLYVDFNSVTFDPNGLNPPDSYDPNYVSGVITPL